MNRTPERHLEDLHISPKPILLILACIGYGLMWVNQMDLTLFAYLLLVAASWIAYARYPSISRWLTIGLVMVVIFLFSLTMNLPSLLILLAFPTALTVTMINVSAGLGASLIISAMLAVVRIQMGDWFPWNDFYIALGVNWGIWGLLFLIYRPVYQHYHWLDEYAESSHKYMHEAQSRMIELNYTLYNLANANRQLKAANERMEVLRTIAEDAQKTKTIFLSKVSHEFRTPLNMIIGLVELMVKNPGIYAMEVPPEMDNDLKVVLRNCQHLSNMINDVLDLTRIETGQVMLHKERVNLVELFDETTTAVQPLVVKKNLNLTVSIQAELPELYIDRTRIRQVILNLVSNAARFTEKGGIQIQASTHNGKVEVCVADTGPGILPEDLEHIFEPFFQGSRDLWRGREGSGLGLSISQQFVKLHDGRLWVESELGSGSQFYFELPVNQVAAYLPSPGQWIRDDWVWREEAFKAGKIQLEQLSNKPQVVLYDQTGGLLPEFARYLDQVDLIPVHDLSSGLDVIRDFPVRAMIINALKEEELLSLTRRACQAIPDLPVIGCAVNRREHRALEMGAAGYLIKPVSSQSLQEAIRKVEKTVHRILVIDDDPEIQHLFQRMLWVLDPTLTVEAAQNGNQAFEKLAEEDVDMIMLDVIMLDMDGWQVLEQLKQDERYHHIPTYIVSAQDPVDRPASSDFLVAGINQGISLQKVLRGTMDFSELLMTPESKLVVAPSSESE